MAYYATDTSGVIGTWTSTTAPPYFYEGVCFSYGGYMYILKSSDSLVYSSQMGSGGFGSWSSTGNDLYINSVQTGQFAIVGALLYDLDGCGGGTTSCTIQSYGLGSGGAFTGYIANSPHPSFADDFYTEAFFAQSGNLYLFGGESGTNCGGYIAENSGNFGASWTIYTCTGSPTTGQNTYPIVSVSQGALAALTADCIVFTEVVCIGGPFSDGGLIYDWSGGTGGTWSTDSNSPLYGGNYLSTLSSSACQRLTARPMWFASGWGRGAADPYGTERPPLTPISQA